jgi:antitoxin MazE6
MKVAISIPDSVHRAVDRAARRMRVPRSQLYVRAVKAYLKHAERADVTARLDAVYGEESSAAEPFVTAAARATLRRTKW